METQKLDKMALDAKEGEKNVGFMDPGQKTPAKRGRPPKSEKSAEKSVQASKAGDTQAQQLQLPPTSVLVAPLAIMLSGFAVEYTGTEKAAMNKDETALFCEGTGAVLDKYFPNAFSKYAPELILCTFLTMYGTRLFAIKKLIAIERQGTVRNPTGPVSDNVSRPKFGPTSEEIAGPPTSM